MNLTKRLRTGALLAASLAALCGGAVSATQTGAAAAEQSPVPGAASRLVYVSSSRGNDSNDGLSPTTPKATLASACSLLRAGSSDWLLLRRGDEWSEGLSGLVPAGASAEAPIVVTAYGSGAEPRVWPEDPATARAGASNTSVYGIAFPEVPDAIPSDAPTLQPGAGWTGATPQPAAVGDPSAPGYDAKAIARWDVVPFQTFDGLFSVGVVAFHMNGIERVDFSVDGGPWTSVREMTMNPRTGVVEYWANLDASLFPEDGPVELRAIAWPVVGEPTVLSGDIDGVNAITGYHNVRLYRGASTAAGEAYVSMEGNDLQGDGSAASPFRTIYRAAQHLHNTGGASRADGGKVLLLPGGYEIVRTSGVIPVTSSRWLTVEPAPGASREEVRIVMPSQSAGGGARTRLLRLHNVTIDGTVSALDSMNPLLWLDRCHIFGRGETDDRTLWSSAWYDAIFATDCLATNCRNAFVVSFARGCEVDRVHADAFPGVAFAVNCEVRNQLGGYDANGEHLHSDIWQDREGTTHDNIIVYGMRAMENVTRQGFFSRNTIHRNIAIVNNCFENSGYPEQNQLATRIEHGVFANNSFLGTAFQLRMSDVKPNVDGYLNSRNVLWKSNVFQFMFVTDPAGTTGLTAEGLAAAAESGSRFVDNHFINEWPGYTGRTGVPFGSVVVGDGTSVGTSVPIDAGAQADAGSIAVGMAPTPAAGE